MSMTDTVVFLLGMVLSSLVTDWIWIMVMKRVSRLHEGEYVLRVVRKRE